MRRERLRSPRLLRSALTSSLRASQNLMGPATQNLRGPAIASKDQVIAVSRKQMTIYAANFRPADIVHDVHVLAAG
jgi:hypothetical protein